MRPDEFEGVEALSELRRHPMTTLLVVMLAGSIGVGLRYGLDAAITSRTGDTFPWSTLAINIIGAFALGLLVTVLSTGNDANGLLRPAIGIGLLGGFTTYSAFALETVALVEAGNLARAGLYIAATNALGVGGCVVGVLFGRALT